MTFHFNHANVINYCQRPFLKDGQPDVEAMNAALIALWNSTIQPHDLIYFLGDFRMNPKWSTNLLPDLHGEKHLILGNHDSHYYKLPPGKQAKAVNQFLRDGWTTVRTRAELTLLDGTRVILSHFPYATPESLKYDSRYTRERPPDDGFTTLLCGHLHGKFQKMGRMIDVGIDAHGLKILSESDIITLINDPRDFIPGPLTDFYKDRLIQEENNPDTRHKYRSDY